MSREFSSGGAGAYRYELNSGYQATTSKPPGHHHARSNTNYDNFTFRAGAGTGLERFESDPSLAQNRGSAYQKGGHSSQQKLAVDVMRTNSQEYLTYQSQTKTNFDEIQEVISELTGQTQKEAAPMLEGTASSRKRYN